MPSIKDFKVGSQWNASGEPVYKLPEFMKQQPVAPVIEQPTANTSPLQAINQQQNAPKITLPDVFRQIGANPNTSPPNSLQMPDFTPRVQSAGNFGQNWSDFLTVAYNQNLR